VNVQRDVGFSLLIRYCDWRKNIVPHSQPIRGKDEAM